MPELLAHVAAYFRPRHRPSSLVDFLVPTVPIIHVNTMTSATRR